MADYKESTVSGTQYVRCHTVYLMNPLGGLKAANFMEETIINLANQQIRKDVGGFQLPLTTENAASTFPLLNPVTGEATGQTMSYQDLYAALYSLYIAGALARDAALEPPQE